MILIIYFEDAHGNIWGEERSGWLSIEEHFIVFLRKIKMF